MQINIIAPNQEGHGTALFENMRASGNIGDIIFIGADDGNLSDLVREGLILDMTDYMEDSENLGPIGTGIMPKSVFGLFERFSTFSAVIFNAVLGTFLLLGKFGEDFE